MHFLLKWFFRHDGSSGDPHAPAPFGYVKPQQIIQLNHGVDAQDERAEM